jgi:tellurite resistance protein TerC
VPHPSLTAWAITVGVIVGLVVFDLWHSARNPRPIGTRSAAAWSLFYVGIAVLFGLTLAVVGGSDLATQYFAGYVVEKSLSVDNLFVFVIIMSTFAVPVERQPRLLMAGIVGALLLRTVFIALGAAMLGAFSVGYLLFGIALALAAVQLLRHRHESPSAPSNVLVSALERFLRLGPSALALVAIASADIMFAFDSIPAVFGVTQHAYIVFAANAFALLGLRALFFLVSGLLERLVYLSTGLAAILAFIAVKLVLHFLHTQHPAIPEIPTAQSLGVIVTTLAVTAVASLRKASREREAAKAPAAQPAPASRGCGTPARRARTATA